MVKNYAALIHHPVVLKVGFHIPPQQTTLEAVGQTPQNQKQTEMLGGER